MLDGEVVEREHLALGFINQFHDRRETRGEHSEHIAGKPQLRGS